jgi:Mn-dependent DtxR family transcriptional regulator
MSDIIAPTTSSYTLAELAAMLGVDPSDAVSILEEHGYPVPEGDERLALTEEEYRELLVPAPPIGDDEPT